MPGPGTVILAKEFKKPITIAMVALIVIVIVAIVRFMRRDKRKAKLQAKELEQELIFIQEKDKSVYGKASETFNISEDSARTCDDIARKINASFGIGIFGNDDESFIIKQLNRLGGPKTIACADFFYKKYRKTSSPNIAFDCIQTLNSFEWKQIREDLKGPLMVHARLKGEPTLDLYFYSGN